MYYEEHMVTFRGHILRPRHRHTVKLVYNLSSVLAMSHRLISPVATSLKAQLSRVDSLATRHWRLSPKAYVYTNFTTSACYITSIA